MLASSIKNEPIMTLMIALEEELNWIIAKQYASEPQYRAFLEIIHSVPFHQSDELPHLQTEILQKFEDLSLRVGEKFKNVIDVSMNQANQLRDRMKDLDEEIYHLSDTVETLQETIESLNNKIEYWQHEYEVLKGEAIEMQAKYQQQLLKVKKEKKEFKRTFLQVQEDTEQDRRLLENLQIQNEEIGQIMLQQKRTKEGLLEELAQIKRHLSDSEKKASASATKIQYEERQIMKLQEEIEAKNRLIEQLFQSKRSKAQSLSYSGIELSKGQTNSEIMTPSDQIIKKVSFVQKFKLGDEIVINEDIDLEFRREGSLRNSMHSGGSHEQHKLNHSVIEQEPEYVISSTSHKDERVPNLYFAHYLLTVQTVKLKLQRQQLLEIDLSGYYKHMIDECVPFHMWDDWISKKLFSLSKLK